MKRLVDVEFEVKIGLLEGYYWEVEVRKYNVGLDSMCGQREFETKAEAIANARAFAELNGLKFKIEGE